MSLDIILEELGQSLLSILAGGAVIVIIIEVLNFVSSF